MKIGTSTVTAIYLGTTSIVSAYLGATQVFGGASAFTPLSLFSGGAQGIWLDPSDVANLDWRRNLLTYSEQFDNAVWVKGPTGTGTVSVTTNQGTAPNTETTADRVVLSLNGGTTSSDRAYVSQTTSADLGVYSIWLKSYDGVSSYSVAIDGAGASVVTVTGSWQRFEVAKGSATSVGLFLRGSYAVSNAADLLVWGAQLELGSTATEYQRISDVNTEVLERFPTATMFSDRAGTTPVTTPGTVVGLRLDKSKGLALGAELVVNGDFSAGATGWTLGTGWAVTGGAAVKTAGISGELTTTIATTLTNFYLVTFTVAGRSAGAFNLRFGSAFTNTVNISANGAYTYRVAPTSPGTTLQFSADGSFNGSIDNISVRELPGNHAVAPTDAARPMYGVEPKGGRRNLLTYSEGGVSTYSTVSNVSDGVLAGFSSALAYGDNSVTRAAWKQSVRTSGETYTATFHVQMDDGGAPTSGDFTFAVVGDGTAFTASVVSGSLYRITATRTATASSSAALTGIQKLTSQSARTFKASGIQLELGSTATNYQRVLSAYDITESGVATCHYVQYDGSDDSMSTSAIDFTATDKMSVFAGVRKTQSADAILLELGVEATTINGAFNILAPGNTPGGTNNNYTSYLRGTTATGIWAATYAPPITNVVTFLYDIAGASALTEIVPRVNGATPPSVTVSTYVTAGAGAGNFGNYPFYIGRRNNALQAFSGKDYGIVIVGKTATTTEISDTETWLAAKTSGVTI